MVCFEWLNFIAINASYTNANAIDVGEDFKENMFGVGASIEKSSHVLVMRELSMLRRFHVCHLQVLKLNDTFILKV
jgi:hypothetical protein